MQNFRTLELATQYYQLIENLSMPGHLKEQLLRSASSVALNLAEGNVKQSIKDKKRIFQIAFGSFRESQTILRLARISDAEIIKLEDHLGACLYKLTTFKS
jgi:four helix bundle protein